MIAVAAIIEEAPPPGRGMKWSQDAIAEARIADADKRAILDGNAAAALARVNAEMAAAA